MNGTRKKLTGAVSAVLLGLSVAGAQAGNAVGYIRIEVPAGLSLMTVPFETIGGGEHTLGSVFGDKLGDGSQVVLFKPGVGFESYTYVEETDPEESGWYKGATKSDDTSLRRGAGFWVRNQSGESVVIFLSGQVPVADKAVALDTGLAIVGFSFPVAADIQELEGLTPEDNDQIIIFRPGVGFESYTYVEETDPEESGWYKGATKAELELQPGTGFWYRRAGGNSIWLQQAPYTL